MGYIGRPVIAASFPNRTDRARLGTHVALAPDVAQICALSSIYFQPLTLKFPVKRSDPATRALYFVIWI